MSEMKVLVFALLFFIAPLASALEPTYYKVERVVDGDTAVLDKLGKVRLVGVNTPESVDPRRPVEFFGKEASAFLKQLLTDKKVRVEYDRAPTDRFGRTLAYLYLEDGTFVNAKIIEEGYGFAFTKYPFKHMEKFRALERDAREKRRGLWADKPKSLADASDSAPSRALTSKPACGAKKRCKQMSSCEEAKFFLKECGLPIDGDGDGVPCEKLCANGP